MTQSVFSDLLSSAARDVRAAFDRSYAISHLGERGRVREERFLTFLQTRLPSNYAIGTGQVVDSLGHLSRQTDGVIYHTASTPQLYTEMHEQGYQPGLFFVEGVAGVVEVKTKLDKRSLLDAFENLRSVKLLQRRSLGVLDLKAGDSRLHPQTPPIAAIFAYASNSPETILKSIREFYLSVPQEEWRLYPEYICVLDSFVATTPSFIASRFIQTATKKSQHEDGIPPLLIMHLDSESSPVLSMFYTSLFNGIVDSPIWKTPVDAYALPHQAETLIMVADPNCDEIMRGAMSVEITPGQSEEETELQSAVLFVIQAVFFKTCKGDQHSLPNNRSSLLPNVSHNIRAAGLRVNREEFFTKVIDFLVGKSLLTRDLDPEGEEWYALTEAGQELLGQTNFHPRMIFES